MSSDKIVVGDKVTFKKYATIIYGHVIGKRKMFEDMFYLVKNEHTTFVVNAAAVIDFEHENKVRH